LEVRWPTTDVVVAVAVVVVVDVGVAAIDVVDIAVGVDRTAIVVAESVGRPWHRAHDTLLLLLLLLLLLRSPRFYFRRSFSCCLG